MSDSDDVNTVVRKSNRNSKKTKRDVDAPALKHKDQKRYVKLTAERITGIDNKRIDYECNLCSAKIGHLDSVARHYISAHPAKINYLRYKLSLRDFLIAKAKIFIDNILERKVLSNDNYGNKARKILTDLIFDPATMNIIDQYNKGYYTKENGSKIISNIEKAVFDRYFDFLENYIKKFRKCLNDLELINLSRFSDDEFIKNVNFEKYIDMNNYKTFRRGYYFLLDIPRTQTQVNNEIMEMEKPTDYSDNLDDESESFYTFCQCKTCSHVNSSNFSLLYGDMIHKKKDDVLENNSDKNLNGSNLSNKENISHLNDSVNVVDKKDKKADSPKIQSKVKDKEKEKGVSVPIRLSDNNSVKENEDKLKIDNNAKCDNVVNKMEN